LSDATKIDVVDFCAHAKAIVERMAGAKNIVIFGVK
jgi:hypothetical protein